MARLVKDSDKKIGTAPGTLFVQNSSPEIGGFYIRYNKHEYFETELSVADLAPDIQHEQRFVHWYHFEGLGREDFFRTIKNSFNLPSLQLADLLNTDHHPKLEDLKDQLFFLLKTVSLNASAKMVENNHLGIFVGEDYVLTFCERPTEVFHYVITRIKKRYGIIRESNEDYLFYSLIDAIIDKYLSVSEKLGNEVEELEAAIAHEKYHKNLTKNIYRLRTEFLLLQKLIVPIKESVNLMLNPKADLFEEDISEYLNDLKDHIKQVENVSSSYRSMASDLLDIYATNINLRTNRVITFLTIFSTIFIPLTFITSLYGMNFKHMPELEYKYAYPVVLALLLTIALGLIFFFKKKKWI